MEEEEEEYDPSHLEESHSNTDSSSDSDSDSNSDSDVEDNVGSQKINMLNMDSFIEEQEQESDEDNDYDYEEEILQQSRKFQLIDVASYTQKHHQESLSYSMDEVYRMCIIQRNEEGNIIDPLHRTLPFLTKYEKTRVIGQRTNQIETGSKPLCKIPKHIIDARIIAQMEFDANVIPFIIQRPLPDGGSEFFYLQDLKDIYLS